MNVTDPIADLLTQIRNGQHAQRDVIAIPASTIKITIAHLLKEEGFIRNYKCIRDRKQGILKIALRYTDDGKGVIQGIDRVSRPSKRIYLSSDKLPFVKNGFGIAIISSSKGVITDKDARRLNVGGEHLCSVY